MVKPSNNSPERIVEEAFEYVYDSCLEPTEENLVSWKALPSHRPRYSQRVTGWLDLHGFILTESYPAFNNIPQNVRLPLVYWAVYETFLSRKRDIKYFEDCVDVVVGRWKRRKKQNIKTWIHLDIKEAPFELEEVKINGTYLRLAGNSDFYRELGRPGLTRISQIADGWSPWRLRCFVSSEYKASDVHEALDLASKDFEILRSILNWSVVGRRIQFRFGGTKERCEYYPPLLYGAQAEREPCEAFTGYGVHNQGSAKISEETISSISEMIAYFEPRFIRGSLRSLLAESMVLANEGLDSIFPSQQFLSCWTALEKLALVDSGSPSEVAKRLPRLWGPRNGSKESFVLGRLAIIRNRLVHEGNFDSDSDELLSWLRLISASIFWQFLDVSKRVKTQAGLKEFYTCFGSNKAEIGEKILALEYLREIMDAGR